MCPTNTGNVVRGKCKACGGILILEMDSKISRHSDPPCQTYLDICKEGNAKRIADYYEDGGKEVDLFNADPNCRHEIEAVSNGGVKCRKCPGWFCY